MTDKRDEGKSLAYLFRSTRKLSGLTADQVGIVCKVGRVSITNIELGNNRPSFRVLGKFLLFFKPKRDLVIECLISEAGEEDGG